MPFRLFYAALLLGFVRFASAVEISESAQTSDLPADPTVLRGTLNNGLRYALRHNSIPQARTNLQLLVLTGSYAETDSQRGYAHFVEHMAFSGTRLFPRDTLVNVLQRHGMAFGADLNANTFGDRTVYRLDLPTSGPDQLKEAVQVLREFADGLSFGPAEVERERGVILQEKQMRDDWAFRAAAAYRRAAYPNNRLGDRPPIGEDDSIRQATAPTLREFYTTWYRADNMVLVAVGDFDPGVLKQEIEAQFNSLPRPSTPLPTVELGPIGNPEKLTVSLFDESDKTAAVAYNLISVTTQSKFDARAARIDRILTAMAFDAFNSRLMALPRVTKKLGRAGSDCSVSSSYVKTARIEVSALGYNWEFAIGTAEQELRRALQYGFTPSEVEEVRKKATASIDHNELSMATRTSPDLASALVDSLVNNSVFTSPETTTAIAREALTQVTPENCLRVFRACWSPGGPRLFVAGKLTRAHPAKAFTAAYQTSAHRAIGPRSETALTDFAYTDFGPPGEIVKRDHIDDLDLYRVEFANGVRLNLKSTPFQANAIIYRARLGFGAVSEPRDQPGLRFLANGFLKMGLGHHDQTELQRLSAGQIAWLDLSPWENAFGLTGGSDRNGAERFFQLLTAFLTDPGWRRDVLPEIRGDTARSFADMENNALTALNVERVGRLANRDGRYQRAPLRKIQGYSLEHLRAWIEPQLKTAPLEMGVVGDFDVEEMIELASRTLGCLPRREVWPAPPVATFTEHLDELVQVPVASTNHHGAVQVTWALPTDHDHATERKIELLGTVLSNRLEDRIRREMGATYSPQCSAARSEFQPEAGFLVASLTCESTDSKRIGETVKAIADDLARTGVTTEEIERARQPKLQSVPSLLRQNTTWIGLVGVAQSQPDKLELARTRASDLESIKVEDLNVLAARTLLSARASVFISIPIAPKP